MISIIISLFSLSISFFLAFRNVWIARRNISIIQTDNAARSIFLKSFDGCLASYNETIPDKIISEPNMHSVILIEIIITNKSSLPISILEFVIPNYPSFTSYSPVPKFFEVTTEEKTKLVIGKPDSIKYLKPEFTVSPYTSERGYILFWSGFESELIDDKDIPLEILTSRGNFKFKINLEGQYESIKKHGRASFDTEGNKHIQYY